MSKRNPFMLMNINMNMNIYIKTSVVYTPGKHFSLDVKKLKWKHILQKHTALKEHSSVKRAL